MATKTFTWAGAASTRLIPDFMQITRTIAANESFQMEQVANGDGTYHFNGLANPGHIKVDGNEFARIQSAPYSYMNLLDTTTTRAGSIWFQWEEDDDLAEYYIDSCVVDSVASPTTCTMVVSLSHAPVCKATWTLTVA